MHFRMGNRTFEQYEDIHQCMGEKILEQGQSMQKGILPLNEMKDF